MRLLGCLCVHARSMAAKRSPVPTKTASTLSMSMRMRSVTTEPSGWPGGRRAGWDPRPWASRGPPPGLGTSLPASARALPCTAPGGLKAPMGAHSDRSRPQGLPGAPEAPRRLCRPRGGRKILQPQRTSQDGLGRGAAWLARAQPTWCADVPMCRASLQQGRVNSLERACVCERVRL